MGSIEHSAESFFASNGQYSIPDRPMGQADNIRVICIGAGASGLNLTYNIQKHMQNVDYVVYEKNEEVGGTWFENRYPGCACDIPCHNYQFTWNPNPRWSQFYASAPEIRQYLKATAEKYDLEKFIKFRHTLLSAEWKETIGLWELQLRDDSTGREFVDSCNFFINGSGYLNHWKWPSIPGLKCFGGELMHTAHWAENTDLKGKRVGVIGNGSSGMQALAAIYPGVKQLVSFSRSPTWVTPNFAADFAAPDGGNFDYSEEQKKGYEQDDEAFLKYRKTLEEAMSGSFQFSLTGNAMQEAAQVALRDWMKQQLGREELGKPLIPNFAIGCRRPTPGLGYLETLTKDNVRLVTDAISEVVPAGIKTASGEIIELDVLVCATGFDYSWVPRFPITGRNGMAISKLWKERPMSYMGLTVQDMPNYFVFLGPQSPLSHGSAIPTIEQVTKYMLRMIWKAQVQSYKSFCISTTAVQEYIQHNDVFHQRTVWGTKCRSWLKGGTEDGFVITHPGSRLQNIHCMLEPRFEDYEWKSLNDVNRFAYMGNGETILSADGKDKTFYVNDANNGYEHIFY